ncbi:MAG: hypothetical protein AB1405_13590, partial [Bdellovibrionota bacterium]
GGGERSSEGVRSSMWRKGRGDKVCYLFSMAFSLHVGERPPLWRRIGKRVWWLLAPLSVFLLFLLFLAWNRIGNDLSIPESPPLEPAERVFAEFPEAYFLLWPADTLEHRAQVLGVWTEEAQLTADEAKAARLSEAIGRVEKNETVPPPGSAHLPR